VLFERLRILRQRRAHVRQRRRQPLRVGLDHLLLDPAREGRPRGIGEVLLNLVAVGLHQRVAERGAIVGERRRSRVKPSGEPFQIIGVSPSAHAPVFFTSRPT
jgi:hypothetical protein